MIKCSQEAVNLNFVLYHENPNCSEDIEDVVFEFEALQASNVTVNINVLIDNRPIDEGGFALDGRVVFLRKD